MYKSVKSEFLLTFMVTTNLQEIFTQIFKRDFLSGPCGFISKKQREKKLGYNIKERESETKFIFKEDIFSELD